jgi:gas vesicle protein
MARKINTTMSDAFMLVGGSVVGAGLALLLAPQSGKKSRTKIARFGRSMGRKGDKVIRNFADNMSEFAGTVGERTVGMLHKR